VIQYGFVTLFVAAFPLTPLFALANNILEVHVDSIKLVDSRRPNPRGAENIGSWALFMGLMSDISIITNAAIIIFATEEVAVVHSPGE
jgi:hypothetical protein